MSVGTAVLEVPVLAAQQSAPLRVWRARLKGRAVGQRVGYGDGGSDGNGNGIEMP